MKREKLFSLFWAAVIAFCIAYGGLTCLVTAFSLNVDTGALAVSCVIFGAFAALLSLLKRGNLILGLLLAMTGSFLWFTGDLENAMEVLVYQISAVYDMAYGWGPLYWSLRPPAGSPELALRAIGAVIVWASVYTVTRRQPTIGALTTGLIPLFACLVVTDTIPSEDGLFLLAFGFLLLILTQTVRRRTEAEGNRLTAILLIPALLCTSLLFWGAPQESYRQPQSIPGWIQSIFLQVTTGSGSGWGVPKDTVDLANVGPKPDVHHAVMEVSAQKGGLMYLRGQSFDIYTGTSWGISSKMQEDPYWPTMGLRDEGVVTIYLRMDAERLYLPYYTDRLSELQYGRYENTGGRTYSLKWLIPGPTGTALKQTVNQDALVTQCLQLPELTRVWAEQFLNRIPLQDGQTVGEKARLIGDYVKGSALYDRNTEKMPAGSPDFARWFLEAGETGYCVHFATAATVLLRAAGIPARYVTGYMATIGSSKTNVLADDSHAWVEYLDYQRGWTILDATPPEPEPLPTDPTSPTAATDPTFVTDPSQETTTPPTQTEESQGSTASTGSTANTGGEEEQPRDMTLLLNCLLALLYTALTVAALWGQYVLRTCLRRRRRKGSPNSQALAMWKEIVHFSKLYRLPLSEELIGLAEKAKFSQHTLTKQERRRFQDRLRELSAFLQNKPWYKRLFWKLVFAAE